MSAEKNRIAGKAALAAAGFAVALFAMEASLRAIYRNADAPDTAYFRSIFERAPYPLMFRFRPNLDTRYYGTSLRTNALGMRDRDLPTVKSGERVLVLGDSFTAGLGLPEEATFPRRLEAGLRARGARSVEVINGGVHGYNTLQETAWLRRYGLALKPDVVAVVLFLNDAQRTNELALLHRNEVYYGESIALLHRMRQTTTFAFVRYTLPVFFERLERLVYGEDYYTRLWDPAVNAAGLAEFDRALIELGRLRAAAGFRAVVLVYPYLSRETPYPYGAVHAEILRRLRRRGFEAVDLAPITGRAPGGRLILSAVNSHPSAEAHQLAAELGADRVLALLGRPRSR